MQTRQPRPAPSDCLFAGLASKIREDVV